MAKVRSANRKRQLLELPSDISDQLNRIVPGLADALNDRLKRAAEHLEATAGLRGQVNIANTMAMEDNPISELKDPVAPQDAVNLRTLKKMLECENLVRILEECADFSEALDNENDTVTPVGFGNPAAAFFIGMQVINIPAALGFAGIVPVSNDVKGALFMLPFDFTVSALTFYRNAGFAGEKAGVGLYNANRVLVVDSGPQDMSTGTAKRITITPVALSAGMYYLASTGSSGGTPPSVLVLPTNTAELPVLNSGVTRYGKVTSGGSAGQLPSTLPAFTTTEGSAMPYVLFESA
jgi:hypothetical protein